MSDQHREEISRRLTPIRPPRLLDDVLGKDQLDAVLGLMRRHGPWETILKHHFSSLEELVATTTGGQPLPPDANLDVFLSPTFRGFFANDGVCFHEEAEPLFYEPRFMAFARDFWNARYSRPGKLMFNVNGPAWNWDPGHLDSPRFRGMGLANTPIWLLSVMGKSGLFADWAIKLTEVIAWFQTDRESGGFTYWPDGPLGAPQRLAPPLWNRGVVTQNTAMYHRGESNGPPALRANPKGLSFDSTFCGDPDDADRWLVKTGDDPIATYATDQLRLLVHWDAELYTDMADMKLHMDHLDDLTPERVFDTFIEDLRARQIDFAVPSDPMTERAFIALLATTYDVGPRAYPEEAPVGIHAA